MLWRFRSAQPALRPQALSPGQHRSSQFSGRAQRGKVPVHEFYEKNTKEEPRPMPDLDRRAVLTAGTAATAAALSSFSPACPALAAAPPAGKQAPGFYRYKVGDIEVTVVTEGARTFPPRGHLCPQPPKEEVNKALEAAYMPRDESLTSSTFAPLLVEHGWQARAHRYRIRRNRLYTAEQGSRRSAHRQPQPPQASIPAQSTR